MQTLLSTPPYLFATGPGEKPGLIRLHLVKFEVYDVTEEEMGNIKFNVLDSMCPPVKMIHALHDIALKNKSQG